MKLNIQEINQLKRENRFNYLRQAEKALIRVKKSSDIPSDIITFPYKIIQKQHIEKSGSVIKPPTDVIHVKVIANTANWIDSQLDLIVPGAWNKSINENKGFIPHLHDHEKTLTAKVGDVTDIYTEQTKLRELGLDKDGETETLIFETDIKKDYNPQIFAQYANGSINQHSISLRYIDLSLGVDDKDDEIHYNNFKTYVEQAINPEMAIENGYLWIVKELRLIENSAVLWGANELTFTQDVQLSDENLLQITDTEAGIVPPQQESEPQKNALDFNYLIKNLKLQ